MENEEDIFIIKENPDGNVFLKKIYSRTSLRCWVLAGILIITVLVFFQLFVKDSADVKSRHQPEYPPTMVTKNAYATLMVGQEEQSQKQYLGALILWLSSLKHFEVTQDIVVMVTPDVSPFVLSLITKFGGKLRFVKRIETEGSFKRYSSMLTKLALWNMTEYDRVAYFDSDHVFLNSPDKIFEDCGDAIFCSTPDTQIAETYFNAGLMVIKPNVTLYDEYLTKTELAKSSFAEQDMLNKIYNGTWKNVDKKYNLMHPTKETINTPDLIAVHEKWWVLKNDLKLTDSKWIWNQLLKNITMECSFEFVFMEE
eukprot:NODE_358_length_10198_cov_0.265076.p3 type:complete len:311 gc:universal NODE_358_length_10198_cov_0.265076:9048-9980(+)